MARVVGVAHLAVCALLVSEVAATHSAYFGRLVLDRASLSVSATLPLSVQAVDVSGRLAYGPVALATAGPGTEGGLLGFLDTLTNTVVATVPLAFAPTGTALDPSGARVYVAGTAPGAGALPDGMVSVIDVASRTQIARLDLGPVARVSTPLVHPAGTFVYVLSDQHLTVIDAATNTITATIATPGADAAVLHPSGRFIYVNVFPIAESAVLVIDTRLDAVVDTVAIPNVSFLGAVVPRGPDDALLFVFGTRFPGATLTTSTVVFDAATGQQMATIPLGARAADAVVDDGGRVYVALFVCSIPSCNLMRSEGVAVIDAAALAVVATLPAGAGETSVHPSGVSLDGTAGEVYVRGDTFLSVIDTATTALAATVPFLAEPLAFQFLFGPERVGASGPFVFYARGAGGDTTAVPWGAPGARPIPADYDGDGRADLAVWRPREANGEGLWYILRSSDGVGVRQQLGAASSGDLPVPADYDGDGRADLAVWRRVEGTGEGVWYIQRSSDDQIVRQQWGAAGDVPVPADYDGDGRRDIAVWRGGTWYILNSRDASIRVQQFGEATDVPVPGDYDGDGRADLAVWRPATGEWLILLSNDNAIRRQGWGAPGDVPIPGDYDGDRRADLAVWRPVTGEWWVVRSSDGAITSQAWGAPGDVPLPLDHDGDGSADLTVYRP